MARAALAHRRKTRGQRLGQPRLVCNLGEQCAAGVRDQTLSVRRHVYREIVAIALHPQGDPPELGNEASTTPILQAQPDIPAPRPARGAMVNARSGLIWRGV